MKVSSSATPPSATLVRTQLTVHSYSFPLEQSGSFPQASNSAQQFWRAHSTHGSSSRTGLQWKMPPSPVPDVPPVAEPSAPADPADPPLPAPPAPLLPALPLDPPCPDAPEPPSPGPVSTVSEQPLAVAMPTVPHKIKTVPLDFRTHIMNLQISRGKGAARPKRQSPEKHWTKQSVPVPPSARAPLSRHPRTSLVAGDIVPPQAHWPAQDETVASLATPPSAKTASTQA
jgi:hypothetical protein